MHPYPQIYLDDVVETQGKLFINYAENHSDMDTEDFVTAYMNSKTRRYIDEGQVYVSTMDASTLFDFFLKTDKYEMKEGKPLVGFLPDWIGEFYAYYQWYYNIPSSEVIKKIPLSFLKKSYYGLHDLDLELAVKKVG